MMAMTMMVVIVTTARPDSQRAPGRQRQMGSPQSSDSESARPIATGARSNKSNGKRYANRSDRGGASGRINTERERERVRACVWIDVFTRCMYTRELEPLVRFERVYEYAQMLDRKVQPCICGIRNEDQIDKESSMPSVFCELNELSAGVSSRSCRSHWY